jgi:hypothetical protein
MTENVDELQEAKTNREAKHIHKRFFFIRGEYTRNGAEYTEQQGSVYFLFNYYFPQKAQRTRRKLSMFSSEIFY